MVVIYWYYTYFYWPWQCVSNHTLLMMVAIYRQANPLLVIVAMCRQSPIVVDDGNMHDDAIKWKHFPRYWPVVRGIHRHR